MIKYYGTPITSKESHIFREVMPTRNALVSFANPSDLYRAIELCEKIMLDNGAFTTWNKVKKGKIKNIDWDKHWKSFYKWVDFHIDNIDYFFIPDVIDGSEEENDELIKKFFKKYRYDCASNKPKQIDKAIPIWHVNESNERLKRLCYEFDYIAFGSAGDYGNLGTEKWYKKMNEAMRIVCDEFGNPKVKIHMLRCLNPDIFLNFPFYSGDSTTLAQNHSRDGAWNIVNRIEKYNSPKKYTFKNYYETRSLF